MSARVVLAIVVGLGGILAGPQRVVLDPEDTRIEFTLGATMHTVEGTIDLVRGTVVFDPETGEASGEIEIDAQSAATGNAKRDRKMHRQVLESERHPRIVFRPTRVEGAVAPDGSGTLRLTGTLDIHGKSRPLEIAADVRRDADRSVATATFRIPYVEWGMEDPSVFLLRVEKHVDVTVEARVTIENVEALP